jgi:hypothetical protein
MAINKLDFQNFIGHIKDKGVMRTTLFKVNIPVPQYLSGQDLVSKDVLSLRCESTALPGLDLIDGYSGPRYGYGPAEFIPYNIAYKPINFVFILDEGVEVQKFFLQWMSSIVNFNNPKNGTLLTPVTKKTGSFSAYEV